MRYMQREFGEKMGEIKYNQCQNDKNPKSLNHAFRLGCSPGVISYAPVQFCIINHVHIKIINLY